MLNLKFILFLYLKLTGYARSEEQRKRGTETFSEFH